MRFNDRNLAILAPLAVKQARETPNRYLDELVSDLRIVVERRHLTSILEHMDRVAAGGPLELPTPRERVVLTG